MTSLLGAERQRLELLSSFGSLGADLDARLHGFVRLASDLFGTPVAAVTVIDADTQWFASSVGLTCRSMPRDHAFCTHAIGVPDTVLVVEDALLDKRFRDNPLVTGDLGVRFYAGAPVRTVEGPALGTLCVIDVTPRRLDAQAVWRLEQLAAAVAAVLELHRAQRRLSRVSTHDVTTGLSSRTAFEERLRDAASAALAGVPCALMHVDVGELEPAIGTNGPVVRDLVLREVGRRLRETTRLGDNVARLGDTEFAVLVPGPTTKDGAEALARRLLDALDKPVAAAGAPFAVNANVGIAIAPGDGGTARALLRSADHALTRAGRLGRPRILSCETADDDTMMEREPSEQAGPLREQLARAIEAGEISVAWQPYFTLASGALRGFEALARWTRPDGQAIAPAAFIPAAEADGSIVELDRTMIRAACRRAANWVNGAEVSVNLSAHWFSAGTVADLVADTLRWTGLAPTRLVVELTERTPVTQVSVAKAQIEALRALGVRVALDDFGVGFSSLGTLRALAIDALKIDRAFVRDLGSDPTADAVFRALIQLGRAIGATVHVEGIETAEQLRAVTTERCDVVQGYLFGRPAPAPSFVHLDLAKRDAARR